MPNLAGPPWIMLCAANPRCGTFATRFRCGPIYRRLNSFRCTLHHSERFTMATRVVVNNSPTQHRPGSIPQTISGVKLSAPSVQPEGASNTRPTLDEMVDRVLVRTKSPLVEEDACKLAEVLEKVNSKPSYLWINVFNQQATDVGATLPNQPAYKEAMLPRTREDLWRIRRSA